MKPARFCILLLLLGVVFPPGGAAKAAESDPIRVVLQAQTAAWNRGSIDGFMEGYAHSPKTIFVSGAEVTRGWQTVHDRYARKYDRREKMGTLTFSEVEITRLGANAALVLGSWSLRRKDDRPHGKFTLLFRKLPEGWRIVLDHTS